MKKVYSSTLYRGMIVLFTLWLVIQEVEARADGNDIRLVLNTLLLAFWCFVLADRLEWKR